MSELEEYYNIDEFKEANDLFENFLLKCNYIHSEKIKQGNFKISTMTVTSNFCDYVNIKMIYQRLKMEENIVYIENSKEHIRGIKKSKKKVYKKKAIKKNNDKRKLGKGNPFSNQISIGFTCNNCNHVHNNPICVKIFKNGNIQMTGCKDIEEVEIVYNQLYTSIYNINTEFSLNDKKIQIYAVKNIKKFKDITIKIEMINGTFKSNFKIDLNKLHLKLKEHYSEEDIFINCEKKTTLICYMKKFKVINKKQRKEKSPSIFIYNTGAINIIAINKEILMNTYNLISTFIDTHFEEIVQIEMEYNEDLIID